MQSFSWISQPASLERYYSRHGFQGAWTLSWKNPYDEGGTQVGGFPASMLHTLTARPPRHAMGARGRLLRDLSNQNMVLRAGNRNQRAGLLDQCLSCLAIAAPTN